MTRRTLILMGLAGLAVFIAAVAAPLVIGPEYGPVDIPVAVADDAAGGSFLAVGLVAAWRRPRSRIGLLMMAVGVVYFSPEVGWFPNALAWSAGTALEGLWAPVLAHVYVSFPSGRLQARRDRLVVAVAYGWSLLAAFASTITAHPVDPLPWARNVFGVLGNQHLNEEINQAEAVVSAVVIALVLATVIGHWRHASSPGRRVLAPVFWTAAPLGVWLALVFFAQAGALAGAAAYGLNGVGSLVAASLPFGFLIGLLRTRLGRGAAGDLVVQLGARAESAERLDTALARVLGDPTVQVLYRVPSESGDCMYVDAHGQSAQLPEGGTGRAVTAVDHGGEPAAALVYDASLLDEPELLEATVAAARLAIDNARLQAQVRAQLEEVRASRARILHAGDVERERIERNLHDGAQQRLLTLSFALRVAESKSGGNPEVKAVLGDAAQELKEALVELRELAQGLHPTVLTRSGLVSAVRAAARRAAVPAELIDVPQERFPADVEAAAYFVVSEALANAGKHASATHAQVSIRRSGGVLRIEVTDDGVGGADATGSGLTGLADRVAVLGGTFSVTSPPGAGTVIAAELPCGP